MDSRTRLATAVSLALGSAAAQASVQTVTLVSWGQYSNSGTGLFNITSSTATWSFDDVTGIVAQTGGVLNVRLTTGPVSTLFRHTATGLMLGGGGAASATTWSCLEGNFGPGVGASICGSYTFGANFANESTLTYSGNTVTRVLGGDDGIVGAAQSVADLDGMSVLSWVGTTLTLSNGVCTLGPNCTTISGAPLFNKGYRLVFNAAQVPVPAAAWLFGGALGALGAFHRRAHGVRSIPA